MVRQLREAEAANGGTYATVDEIELDKDEMEVEEFWRKEEQWEEKVEKMAREEKGLRKVEMGPRALKVLQQRRGLKLICEVNTYWGFRTSNTHVQRFMLCLSWASRALPGFAMSARQFLQKLCGDRQQSLAP